MSSNKQAKVAINTESHLVISFALKLVFASFWFGFAHTELTRAHQSLLLWCRLSRYIMLIYPFILASAFLQCVHTIFVFSAIISKTR